MFLILKNYTPPLKKLLSLITLLCQLRIAYCQSNYWQQQVDYTIDVTLHDSDNTLNGFEKIIYTNHSPDTLSFIWFHIWPNAYKNDKTAFCEQELLNGNTDFYFSNPEQRGYINRLDFRVNDITAETQDHPQYIDIIKLILPSALLPGGRITITTPFHEKLPFNFSRGGHDGESYQVTQWYPKPAVYDKKGWHPIPYLDQGEFYSEFGSFDVRITVPRNYVVAATGELQNEDEKNWLRSRANFDWTPEKRTEKNVYGQIKKVTQSFPASSKEFKTIQYRQANIHDFAWFADKRFIVNADTCRLPSGKTVEVYTYYTPDNRKQWKGSVQFVKDALRHYSSYVGEYAYPVAQAVQGPKSFGGGMEYPTVTVISPEKNIINLDETIAHEVGHNWFYGMLGTNERDHAWMDEGINTFYEYRYRLNKYGKRIVPERFLFETLEAERLDQPIELPSEKFTEVNYEASVYFKTAEWMHYLETVMSPDAFNKAMQQYFADWKFKHPQPEDFKQSVEGSSGKNLDEVFSLLNKKGSLPTLAKKGVQASFILDIKHLKRYLMDPSKDLILYSPIAEANSYDKLMPGIFVTNLKLPPSRLEFYTAPLYSFPAKKLAGNGRIDYSFFPEGPVRKITASLTASSFTFDQYTDNAGKKNLLRYQKIVPGLRFVFREKNPLSHFTRSISFRSYLFTEDRLNFYRDTVISGTDTNIVSKYNILKDHRYINQLKFTLENSRALYPYRAELAIEQGQDFIRTGFTGNYFFNYPRSGGLSLRFFAGKFFYTTDKTPEKMFETDRYHLNMTGPNGYEDYTFSDYFIGRNNFTGIFSQQIKERDGFFKTRTDLLADKVGKTDDWLMALNLVTTIPDAVNPLHLLPLKIPLDLFADIGTYAEAWKKDAPTDRFLFDAGVYLPLFRGLVNIFIPLLYSDVYKNYYESTIEKKIRFWKKISFSIGFTGFKPMGKLRDIHF